MRVLFLDHSIPSYVGHYCFELQVDFEETDEKFQSRPRGSHKRKYPTIECSYEKGWLHQTNWARSLSTSLGRSHKKLKTRIEPCPWSKWLDISTTYANLLRSLGVMNLNTRYGNWVMLWIWTLNMCSISVFFFGDKHSSVELNGI